MRKLQAFKQAAGILTGVLLILYFLRTALGALLEDTAPYSLTREELDAELAHSETNGVETIPKIIHQVYLGWGGLPMPAIWNITRKTCVDMNPDYEHMVEWPESRENGVADRSFSFGRTTPLTSYYRRSTHGFSKPSTTTSILYSVPIQFGISFSTPMVASTLILIMFASLRLGPPRDATDNRSGM